MNANINLFDFIIKIKELMENKQLKIKLQWWAMAVLDGANIVRYEIDV